MNKIRITESQLRGIVKRMIKEEMQTPIQKFKAVLEQSFGDTNNGNPNNENVIVLAFLS